MSISDQPISVSRMTMISPDSSSESSDKESDFKGQGYRLMDLNKFSSKVLGL